MRSIRLGRVFDRRPPAHAVSYMASRADLASAIAAVFEHNAYIDTGHEVFLGLRAVRGEGA